jgi:hypothetical protein
VLAAIMHGTMTVLKEMEMMLNERNDDVGERGLGWPGGNVSERGGVAPCGRRQKSHV